MMLVKNVIIFFFIRMIFRTPLDPGCQINLHRLYLEDKSKKAQWFFSAFNSAFNIFCKSS